MTFNKYTWDLYKQANGGRRTIEQFEKAAQLNFNRSTHNRMFNCFTLCFCVASFV